MNSPSTFELIAAPVTPMDDEGAIRFDLIDVQVESFVRDSVSGAFVCGSTGEGISMSTDERMRVSKRWAEVSKGRLNIIVHAGHNSIADAQALAAHAQQIKANAVACISPSVFKPGSIDDLIDFCSRVASSAPELPFYYYHIPVMTGVNFKMAEFLPRAAEKIRNFAGIKFTHEDLMDFAMCQEIVRDRKGLKMFWGRDEILLASLPFGTRGAVGSTYGFAAPLYHRMIRAFDGGEIVEARKFQMRAIEMIAVLIRFGGIPAMKPAMKLVGIDCGPCRPPLRRLDQSQRNQVAAELLSLNIRG